MDIYGKETKQKFNDSLIESSAAVSRRRVCIHRFTPTPFF